MIPLTQMLGDKIFTGVVDYWLFLVVIILLVISAFFSSSETAYTTSNHIRIKSLADDNVKGSRTALYIIENFDKTITTILVGNNFVNIFSTTICAYVFAQMFVSPTLANVVNTVVMTVIVLIFGEILPKSLAKINPERFALRFAGIMRLCMIVLSPLSFIFLHIQRMFTKHIKGDNAPTITEDELEDIIDTMEEEGVIDSDNADLIQGALDLGDTCVYDIMTPRVDMITIDYEDTEENIEAIKNMFVEYQYSRIPVCDGDKDHIIGVLNQKDFFMFMLKHDSIDLKKIISEPMFVSEKLKVDDLIRQMQANKKHLAIVLDEYGGTSGLVTMEDALEEVVGEIYDEHDQLEDMKDEEIKKIGENQYEVDADIGIEDLFEELEIEHLPETEYNSLAGFLYDLSENLPEKDKVVTFTTIDDRLDKSNNYIKKVIDMKFTLIDVEDRRIRKVLLDISDKSVDDQEEDKAN